MTDQQLPSQALQLDCVQAENLRCHRRISWRCERGLNLLTGANGSGKTTLLEAVFLMGHGRSFRQARDPNLVRYGSPGFSVRGRWRRFGPMRIDVESRRGGVQVRLQGRVLQRRGDISENLPILAESPQATRLVDGTPSERRRWLDQMTLYCRPDLVRHYQAYLRCLMQRSRLLRRPGSSGEIEVWERQMAEHGLALSTAREDVTAALNRLLDEEGVLCEQPLSLALPCSAPDDVQAWADKLAGLRRSGQRILRIGPHCDRLRIHFGERDIRGAGSRGQQKLAAIALRLAECRLRMQHRGIIPVLLLDDCFEALDAQRREHLMRRLQAHEGQILMTGPDAAGLPGSSGCREMHCTVLKADAEKESSGYHQCGRDEPSAHLEEAA